MAGADAPKSTASSSADPAKAAADADLFDYDPDSPFQCCVCLDLLYKPVVLACGHISCFWCVHKAMHGLQASHCAICRQLYRHFPSICILLHFLILKLEPVAYKRREKEVLEEEQLCDIYSPQLPDHLLQNKVNVDPAKEFFTCTIQEGGNFDERLGTSATLGHFTSPEKGLEKQASNGVSISDVLCSCCKEMLYQPVILNCGHAYCESCLSSTTEPLTCQVCQSLHPGEFPNVCLDLDHFLEEQFPGEYESRKQHVLLEKGKSQYADPSSSALDNDNQKTEASSKPTDGHTWNENLSNVHVGVGCDSCGMYPIIGKRYRCKDCTEAIGFDLCEACYNTTSKLPGRFNQQHTPDHEFELDESQIGDRLYRLRAILANDLQPHILAPQILLPLDDVLDQDDEDVVSEGSGDEDVVG